MTPSVTVTKSKNSFPSSMEEAKAMDSNQLLFCILQVEQKILKTLKPPTIKKTRPVRLNPKLCQLLSVPVNTQMTRGEVTRALSKYANKHNLKNPSKKSELTPNDEMVDVFGMDRGPMNFLNISKFISKQVEPVSEEEESAPST